MRFVKSKVIHRSRLMSLATFLTFAFVSAFLFFDLAVEASAKPDYSQEISYDGIYDWETNLVVPTSSSEYMSYSEYRDTYCLASSSASVCASAALGKKIRIDTAEELYRFSVDVSFERVYLTGDPVEDVKLAADKINVLLSLDYVLGNDIDYSVMAAKTFIPIGYWFYDTENTLFYNIFSGTFDGQGFTISNLYVAGYDYLVYIEVIDELNSIDIALSSYYSMFAFNNGTITNLGLIDPTLELLELHIDIDKTANLVGFNTASGIIDHVFVMDTRTDVLDAGIRYKVGTASQVFTAAGVVHTNEGTFTDAYYVSKVVINGAYINRFQVQPVLYANVGTIDNLVYDSSVYLLSVLVGTTTITVTTPNGIATAETTSTLKSDASSLNDADDLWYFYPLDTYPITKGLVYDVDTYLISDPLDLVFFSQLIGFLTVYNGTAFSASSYRLTDDIDMSIVAADAYVTPSATFTGSFSGDSGGLTLADNYYIFNLHMVDGTIRGGVYYAGLFGLISGGSVDNLNIDASSITLTNTESYYSMPLYVGMVTGRLTAGTIENVMTDVTINLGDDAIGETHVGGIAGRASGLVSHVSVSGTLDAGNHVYQSTYTIAPSFNIGGIIGSATGSELHVHDAVNNGAITGYGTLSTFNLSSGSTTIAVRIGGVIGYILNTTTISHSLTNISNKGDISFRSVTNSVGLPGKQNIGGVFGEIAGAKAPVLEDGNGYVNANYYNSGDILGTYAATTARIRAAGIGVVNMSIASEFAMFYNHGSFVYDTTGVTTNNTFFYTGGLYDAGAVSLTLSRIYNYGDFLIKNRYFVNINPLFYSENNNITLIRFSANYGDVLYHDTATLQTITLTANLILSGITTNPNVNYLNVHNYGDLSIVDLAINTYTIDIAGITYQLTSGYYIKNALNQGNITVAKITGSGGIFMAGIVNRNNSGDLQDAGQSPTQPRATIGILNTVNYGVISTSYGVKTDNYYGIHGTSNTFAAGIATLNAGSIQDSANLGDVRLYNSYTTGTFTFSTNTDYAGQITAYTAGVSAGGIVAVSLSTNSRVYDTANNGDIVAMAYKYARAGGVLSTSLYTEALAGGITAGMGLLNTIQTSVLSNGLNFGNIIALTNEIAAYTTTASNQTFAILYGASGTSGANYTVATTSATQDRPAVYSSAGGVIGYGLCVMRRMLNHGTIAATDVAGGIVGATYVLGGSGQTTVVNINTAINYGNIKAIPNTNVMGGGTNVDAYELSYTNASGFFMADGNTFIFPTGYTRLQPRAKRGFGGVFGRLQRGTSGVMTSAGGSFDFIVNANPNIDLIGRLDQVYNFSSSSRYFRFNNAIYYSAKLNDTTQVVFTGFYYAAVRVTAKTSSSPYTYTTTVNQIYSQIGIVATLFSSPGTTGVTFVSTSNYAVGTTIRYFYYTYASINIPWITENPSDPNITNAATQYMYHASFPMRTNETLTEYIYYMEYNLLADRFKTGGSTPRVNGMYVLSTSSGSSYGLVLPANIDDGKIYAINEDHEPPISLLIDYTNVSSSYRQEWDAAVNTKYLQLKQTTFANKHEMVESTTDEIALAENGGSGSVLANGTVDYVNYTVTFSISLEAYLVAQTTASFAITSAPVSAKALVAIRPDDYFGHAPSVAELESFNNLLLPETGDGISLDYPALLSVTLPSRSITTPVTLSIGYYTVFSEAFVNSDLFASTGYYTSYQVYIEFTPTIANSGGGSIGITQVAFNGGANVAVTNQTNVTALGTVGFAGSIKFTFTDTLGVLVSGYDFKNLFVLKFNDGTVVPSTYYTVTSTPVAIVTTTGTYTITFTFDGQTRMGNYYFEYRYFTSSTLLSVLFTKGSSTNRLINSLTYYSANGSVVIAGTTITSYVNLGYLLDLDAGANFTSTTNGAIPSYLDNVTYDVDYMTAGGFVISPFASLTNVTLVSTTFASGYKVYVVTYTVVSESGASTVYTHTIYERTVDLTAVLKEGNEVDLGDVFASREDSSTEFQIDLGLDQNLALYSVTPGAYDYFEVSVSATSLDGLTNYTSGQIVGLSYHASDYLYIDMDYSTIPGLYHFTFLLHRDGSLTTNIVTYVTTLTIKKNAGTAAYLSDIRFTTLVNDTAYPIIRITDAAGVVQSGTGLDLRVYFGGIDYDGADLLGYTHFRIDGLVSKTPLNEYVPYMLDYLPFGATLSRHAYDFDTSTWYWTPEVTNSSTQEDKNLLLADFTIDPVTGEEPLEGQTLMVQYRVTAEDGLTTTDYFITVTDVYYNLSVIFDLYYCTGAGVETCTLASQSVDFINKMVIINVKNYLTDGDDTVINVTDPLDYPDFTELISLNNRMTQFYYTYSGAYRYSLGSNSSGFYIFELLLPEDQYMNDLYTYEIQFLDYTLNDASDYVTGIAGKYFYIGPSTITRTRRFNIYIRAIASPSNQTPWGLFDFFRSWGDQ